MNTKPFIKGDSLESLLNSEHIVEIEKMAIGGDGVARISFQEKLLVVFVSKSAPQDLLKIKITQTEKKFLFGSILEVLKPGKSRREPPCIYANLCGGCSWQQFSENEQINQKELLLKELFKKFIPEVSYDLKPTIASPENFKYRNRIQLKHTGNSLGYFEEKSHTIVDIESCLIADSKISDEIIPLKRLLKPTPEVIKYELKITEDCEFKYHRIGEVGQGIAFSQVNTKMNIVLQNHIIDLIKAESPPTLTELYAGSGNFTFGIAQALPATIIEAVELNSELTKVAAKKIMALSLQKKLYFFTSDCDDFVKRRSLSADFIFLDPPRQGCSETVLSKIHESKSKNILYLSCHPVSLARDLQKLDLTKNGYSIKLLQIFDMFPQTDHFETLVLLTKLT